MQPRVLITERSSLSLFQTVSQPTKPADSHTAPLSTATFRQNAEVRTHTHTHTRLDNIYDSGDYTRYKTHKKGLLVCKEHCNRPHYKTTGN